MAYPPTGAFGSSPDTSSGIATSSGTTAGEHATFVLVPDERLLFTADFKRAGPDLVLTGEDGHRFVVYDYFNAEQHPALRAPNGAILNADLVDLLAGSVAPGQYAQAAPTTPPAPIGKVEKVIGNVTVARNGVAVALHVGDAVYKSDVIQTGANSSVGIVFPDGTGLNLISNTRMALNEYVYDEHGSSNSALLSLVEGSFAFVAGKVAKTGDMKIATPVATMGIRGTTGWVQEQVATITATLGNVTYSFAVTADFGGNASGLYDLVDTDGNVIATVSRTGFVTFVTPQPGAPPLVSTLPMTDSQLVLEQQMVQGVFQALGLINATPRSLFGPGSSSSIFDLNEQTPVFHDSSLQQPASFTINNLLLNGFNTPQNLTVNITPTPPPTVTLNALPPDQLPSNANALASHSLPAQVAIDNNTVTFVPGTATVTDPLGVPPGLVTVDPQGNINYDQSKFAFLAQGETVQYTVTFEVEQGNNILQETLTLTIIGANEAPSFASTDTPAQQAETPHTTGSSQLLTATAVLPFTDPDLSDTGYSVTVTGVTATDHTQGLPDSSVLLSFLQPSGVTKIAGSTSGAADFTFAAADKTFDYLAQGETVTLQYTVAITDPHGATGTETVSVTITGSNDTPTLSADSSGAHPSNELAGKTGDTTDTETASGSLAFTDVDLSDTHTASPTLVSASWQKPDGLGGFVTAGTVQPATLAALSSALATPIDNTSDSTGGATGHVNWSFSAADQNFDFLAQGETLTLTYDIVVTDNNGSSSTQPITITVTGTNDAPAVSADPSTHSITEATNSTGDTVSGTLAFTDVDLDDTHTVASQGAPLVSWQESDGLGGFVSGVVPTATINALTTALQVAIGSGNDSTNGATSHVGWTFSTPDQNFDFLAQGETLTVTYQVAVTDNNGLNSSQPVTITINGSNDAPQLLALQVADPGPVVAPAGTPGASLVESNDFTFIDADLSDHHTISFAFDAAASNLGPLSGPIGTFEASLAADSTSGDQGQVHWSLTVDPELINNLPVNTTVSEVFDVTVDDGHGGTAIKHVTLVFEGPSTLPNSAPTPAPDAVSVLEDATASATTRAAGVLGNDTDPDSAGETAALVVSAILAGTSGAATQVLNGGLATVDGSFGALAIHSDGTYSYTPNNPAAEALAQGQHATDTFTYTVVDPHGAASTSTLTFNITGVNDPPVITSSPDQLDATITETAGQTGDANPADAHGVSGLVSFTDVDLTDLPAVTAPFASINYFAADGTTALTLTPDQQAALDAPLAIVAAGGNAHDGSATWTYSVADNALDFLAAGETLRVTYTATVDDTHGGITTQPITITISGSNDSPVITSTPDQLRGTIIETAGQTGDANPADAHSVSGVVSFTDVDLSDRPTVTAPFASISYFAADGTTPLTLTSDQQAALEAPLAIVPASDNTDNGSATWTYTIADNALDFLARDETLTLTYTATLDDGHGGIETQPITVTITGTNDTPVLNADPFSPHQISELIGQTNDITDNETASGTLSFTDVDLTDSHSVSVAVASTTWSGGDTLPTGLEAVLAGALSTTVADSTGSGSGSVGFTFSAADNNFDFLGQGETLTVTYDVTVSDGIAGSTKPVTITISGSNDAPALNADTSGPHQLSELSGQTGDTDNDTASGTLTFTDIDLTDTHVATVAVASTTWSGGDTPQGIVNALAGALTTTLTENSGAGSIGFTFSAADNTFDFLAQGETLTVTYDVTVNDGIASSTEPVVITITGTNDTPVLNADTSGSHQVTELPGETNDTTDNDTASASLSFIDVDLNDSHSVNVTVDSAIWSGGNALPTGLDAVLAGARSTTLADSTGTGFGAIDITFSAADNNFDFLAQGETLSVTYDVTVSDGITSSTEPVTITITGTNDAPVLNADTSGPHQITEGQPTGGHAPLAFFQFEGPPGNESNNNDTASGTLTFTDVDLNDTHTVGVTVGSTVWSGGDTLPTDLDAVLAGALSTTLADSTGSGSGSIDFTFSAADSNFDFLGQGQTLTVTYDVKVDDGIASSIAPVIITITGTNDRPALNADTSGPHQVIELSDQTNDTTDNDTATGSLSFTDVDLSDNHTVNVAVDSTTWSGGDTLPTGLDAVLAGALTTTLADSTGSGSGAIDFAFSAADNNFDFLAQGETLTVTYEVTVSDRTASSTEPVIITITGTNDAPTIVTGSTDSGGAVTEDRQPITVSGGTVVIDVSDPTTVTLTASGAITFQDVDLTDTHTATAAFETSSSSAALPGYTAGTSHIGSFTIDAAVTEDNSDPGSTGTLGWSFTLADDDPTLQSLAQDQVLTQVYTITLSDGLGGTTTQDVTISISGTNDAPVLNADTSGPHAIFERFGLTNDTTDNDTASGSLTFTDIDLTDSHSVSVAVDSATWSGGETLPTGLDGVLADALSTTLTDGTGSGSVDFTFSAADNNFDFLAQGESLTITYDVTVSDGIASSTEPVTITITGSNDRPELTADTSGPHQVTELVGQTNDTNDNDTAAGSLSFTDADLTDTHSVSVAVESTALSNGNTLPDGLGDVLAHALSTTLADSTGSGSGSIDFTFSAADNNFDFLAQGETLTVIYDVTVSDNGFAGSTEPVTITITGSNDAPVANDDGPTSTVTYTDNFHDRSFNFQGTNSPWLVIPLGNSNMDWSMPGGDVTEASNSGVGFLEAPQSVIPAGATTYTINVDADPNPNGFWWFNNGNSFENNGLGVVFGYTDANDYYLVDWKDFGTDYRFETSFRDLVLEHVSGGHVTILDRVNDIDLGNSNIHFKIAVDSSGISVDVDGDENDAHLSSSDVPAALNGVGLYTNNNDDGVSYDHFSVSIPGSLQTYEDQVLNVSVANGVLANDTDVDSPHSSLTVATLDGDSAAVGQPTTLASGATLTLNADGSFLYDPSTSASLEALAAGAVATDTFTYTAQDDHSAESNTATVTITVTGINDAPAGTDNTVSTNEDTPYVFGARDFGFSDPIDTPDDNFLAVKISALPTAGFLFLLNGHHNDGDYDDDDGQVVCAGDLVDVSDINRGLLVFVPASNANGTGYSHFSFQVQDDGGTAHGGVDLDQSPNTMTIDVTPVNDAPVLRPNANSVSYTELAAAVKLMPTATVSDPDNPANFDQGSITVSLSNANAGDEIVLAGTAVTLEGSDVTIGSTTVGTISGYATTSVAISLNSNATDSAVETMLRALAFASTSHDPTSATRSATVTFDDGGNIGGGDLSDNSTVTIHVTAVNDPPTATSPSTHYSATEQTDLSLKGTLSVGDVDSDGGSETVTLAVGEGTLTVTAGNSGASVLHSGNSSVTINGTIAQINSLFGSSSTSTLIYNDNTDNPSAHTTLTLSINDNDHTGSGGAHGASTTSTIDISAVNDPPVNTVPSSIVVIEDTATKLTGISVTDPDAGGSTGFVMTLSVDGGSLSATTGGGVTVGGDSSSLTLTGTFTDIDAFLAGASGVTYTPVPHSLADATLTVTSNDHGATGGGDQTDVDTVTLDLQAPIFAPTIVTPANGIQYWDSDTSGDVTPINRISFNDSDAGSTQVLVTFKMDNHDDSLDASNLSGSGVTVFSGNHSDTLVLQGTINNINSYLYGGNLFWNPDDTPNHASGTLTVTIDDNGTASGGNVVSTTVAISEISVPSFSGSSSNDFSGVNFTNIDPGYFSNPTDAGSGNDTITTAWSHDPSFAATVYDGNSGTDTVNLVFTPDQLGEILASTSERGELSSFLSSPSTNDLDLSHSSWNAEAEDFEHAHVDLVTGYGTGTLLIDSFLNPLPSGSHLKIGTSGDNTLAGNTSDSNANVIVGLGGNDTLTAGKGSSLILGGAGNDTITSGPDDDILSGGGGNDTFVFNAVTDSHPGSGQFDIIADFSHGADKIDLAAITGLNTDVQSVSFNLLTSTPANIDGHTIDIVTSGGNTVVYANAGASSQTITGASMEIHLASATNLTSTDFILHH